MLLTKSLSGGRPRWAMASFCFGDMFPDADPFLSLRLGVDVTVCLLFVEGFTFGPLDCRKILSSADSGVGWK